MVIKIKTAVSDENRDPIIQHVPRNFMYSHRSCRLFCFISPKHICKRPHFINKPDTWGLQQSLYIWRTVQISGLFCYLYLSCGYESVPKLRPPSQKMNKNSPWKQVQLLAARLACTNVQTAWYSLLNSAPDDGRVVRPKHVQQVKNSEIKIICMICAIFGVLLHVA